MGMKLEGDQHFHGIEESTAEYLKEAPNVKRELHVLVVLLLLGQNGNRTRNRNNFRQSPNPHTPYRFSITNNAL